jgi:hypothetical protein
MSPSVQCPVSPKKKRKEKQSRSERIEWDPAHLSMEGVDERKFPKQRLEV